MDHSSADRNLLLGVLALQMDFVGRGQLVTAMKAWVADKQRPLSQLLADAGDLTPEKQGLVEALLLQHLKQHGNDPARSLAEFGVPTGVLEDLQRIADADLQACLRQVTAAAASATDAFATRATATEPTAHDAPADPYATSAIAAGAAATPSDAGRAAIGTPTSSGLRFRILRPYARGGLGEVLVAEDRELHREVALKQIQDRHADDPESRNRFIAEAEITGALEHPSIVPVYGLGQYADGRPFYAMRFIRGDSLHDAIERFHLKEGPKRDPGERALSLQELLNRFEDVCQAIAYAHSRGILHRDLKPGNIMLGKYGETLVVDWGLAKPIGEKEPVADRPKEPTGENAVFPTITGTATLMGSAVGTPHYMSPEQAAGDLDRLGPASDVYSLGATLYTLLTGKTPIPDREVGKILYRVKTGDFPKPRAVKPEIHPALEAICLKAMALKPPDRYTSPQLLVDDINHWIADEPVSAWPEPWTVRAGRWLRRHKMAASMAAAGTAALIVFLIILSVVLNAAKKREELLKDKAVENFQLAVRAVDRYHTDVSESVLLQEPGTQPLRLKLLGAAQEFYAEFVDKRGDDAALRGEFARALYRLGLITAENENETKAIELLSKAAAILQRENVDFRGDLARCYRELGKFYRMTDDGQKSEEMYQKSLETWAGLTAAGLDVPATDLARSQNALGNHYQQVSRSLEKAEAEYRQALATWSKLSDKEAKEPENLRYVGLIHSNLGVVYTAMGNRAKEASDEFEKAIALQAELARTFPNISKFQDDLAASYFNLGDLHRNARNYQDALVAFEEASKIWRKASEGNPTVILFHSRLGDALSRKALTLSAAGKSKEAIQASKDAVEVQARIADKDPAVPKYRGELARRYVGMADVLRQAKMLPDADKAYQDAIELQLALTKERPDTAHFQADLARSHHGLGLLRQAQKELPQAETEFTKALALWQALRKSYPQVADYTSGLATEYWSRAEASTARATFVNSVLSRCWPGGLAMPNLYREALPDWDEAFALAADKDRMNIRFARAMTLARGDQAEHAAAEAKALAGEVGKDVLRIFYLARLYAVASAAASKQQGDSARKLAEASAESAVAQLEQVYALNANALRGQRKALLADADWRALHARESFQALMRKLNGDDGKD